MLSTNQARRRQERRNLLVGHSLACLKLAIVHTINEEADNYGVSVEIYSSKVEVALIFCGTGGFVYLREGRYSWFATIVSSSGYEA
jgi:hypothetical protein